MKALQPEEKLLAEKGRYDPPPSYPNLKILGLNAPIPGEANFGYHPGGFFFFGEYHPGGWGKPPFNESGLIMRKSRLG